MLKVSWFDHVAGEVDDALAALPECAMCPHDLYRALVQTPRPARVRIALVADGDGPVAVIGLAQSGALAWEPITNWLFPGEGFPARPGRAVDALAALGVEAPVAWWRMGAPPPRGPMIHDLDVTPAHRLDDLAKREEFWRSTDYLRHIKNIRNRTRGLELRIGVPEIAEQVAAGWFGKWISGDSADPQVRARVLIADALEPLGRHITVGLFDDGKLAAGSTNFIHNGELVAGILYMPDEYRRLGAGVRLIDVMFQIAEERGLSAFDLGGAAEYKRKWAPPVGERVSFVVAPPGVRFARKLAAKAKALLRGGARASAPAS